MQKRGLGRGLAALIPENRQESSAQDASGRPDESEVRQIPVGQVEASPYQPRTQFDPEKMADLVASVREHGILQPVLVRQMAPQRYQLVAGERRFRAAERAGLASIPALVRECTDREQLEIAVVENLQREDIGAMEAARAYRRLIDEFEMTQDSVAQRVGKSRSAIANMLRLLRLPEEVQDSVEQGEISEGHARALLTAEFNQAILHAWNETRKRRLSVRETERLAKRSRESMSGGGNGEPQAGSLAVSSGRARDTGEREADPNESAIVDRIQQALGTKVAIRRTGTNAGRIEIGFYSAEDLQRLTDLLLQEEASR
jgi:ParB family chromosome partitioning protein